MYSMMFVKINQNILKRICNEKYLYVYSIFLLFGGMELYLYYDNINRCIYICLKFVNMFIFFFLI